MSLSDPYAKVYLLHEKEEEKFKTKPEDKSKQEQEETSKKEQEETSKKEQEKTNKSEIIISKFKSRTITHSNQLSPKFDEEFSFKVRILLILAFNCNHGSLSRFIPQSKSLCEISGF